MKVLILNSGMGSRMGVLTSEHPKCMTKISSDETILSRQLKQIMNAGITEIVMTTGAFDKVLIEYCKKLDIPVHITFVKNPIYDVTNYIYSIYCAKEYLDDDIILMHGDLVFDNRVFELVASNDTSCMTVSSTVPLPEKDFKAVVQDGKIIKVGIEFFENAMAAQPLYKLLKDDWRKWLNNIIRYCEHNDRKCYAENALNEIANECNIKTLDVEEMLCNEIDNSEDLKMVLERVAELKNR